MYRRASRFDSRYTRGISLSKVVDCPFSHALNKPVISRHEEGK